MLKAYLLVVLKYLFYPPPKQYCITFYLCIQISQILVFILFAKYDCYNVLFFLFFIFSNTDSVITLSIAPNIFVNNSSFTVQYILYCWLPICL